MNKFIVTAFVTLLLTVGFGSTADAQVHVRVKPNRPAHVLKKPAHPKKGFVWVDGHWRWNAKAKKYDWVKARWVKKKPGHNWVPGHWTNDPKRGHKWVPGHWRRR